MRILKKHMPMIAMMVAAALTNITPAAAMPIPAKPVVSAPSDVENVQYRRYDGYRGGGRYYRGHRGYRDYRPGYRRHNNGYWFPLAAFAAGAIIAGSAAQAAPSRSYGSGGVNPRHYDWCAGRYRSYDARSNTFQPYNGPRQQCLSPYY